MPQEYQPAPEVEDVARGLIDAHHSHLGPVRIEYVFASEPLKEKGKIVWGKTKKVSGLNAWLAADYKPRDPSAPEEFFLIEIVKPVWLQLDEKSRRALVDHELTHCDVTPEGKLALRPHDLEEFNSIVRRYGLWRADVQLFLEAAKHPDLFSSAEDNRDYERATVDFENDRLTKGATS
jgi:hypothetical protein